MLMVLVTLIVRRMIMVLKKVTTMICNVVARLEEEGGVLDMAIMMIADCWWRHK